MIEISLNDFMKELIKQNPEKTIKLLPGHNKNNLEEIILVFSNAGYYITDKIQKIDYAEYNKLAPLSSVRFDVHKGDHNWCTLIGFLYNRFGLSDYPEIVI